IPREWTGYVMNVARQNQPRTSGADRIAALLECLYGAHVGSSVVPHVCNLLDEFRPRLFKRAGRRGALPLTQRDAFLITYADMVQEEGTPPLRSLAEFCEIHLREVVSGIHLLPHFPYTSDDGFAVTDYFAVNPVLGTWGEVARLGQLFDLMF